MNEDKAKIAEALGKVFAMTREDIARLEYEKDPNDEWVKVFNKSGNEILKICVTGYSGVTMVMDVSHAIQSDIVMGGKNK
ncbi:MAG: hypothetical protein J6N55_12640 [Anaerovibrio sp.]|uniref:hypothetical protein n=1 Tax=Anaerovibrio sp. TaxID=1872532 RepID=UPI001B2A50EA|nr:hypothetical protein [Anaerovibrio sp.]MBO6247111.1 hypothetical protein [Anaerovibrio sp.]